MNWYLVFSKMWKNLIWASSLEEARSLCPEVLNSDNDCLLSSDLETIDINNLPVHQLYKKN